MGDIETVQNLVNWRKQYGTGCNAKETDALARVLAVAEAMVAHDAARAATDKAAEIGGAEWGAAMEAEHASYNALRTAVAALRTEAANA